ncbi:hypothetical protein PYW08_010243 [Mythimna loreyi]|uniref:Uncharacterized protein n=1 Tax=Mythimna loreyi TaxID=667449 RepID=A0ACC2Q7P2_9NEOP|nr:hypothetical protein PYW08_010243 [Mythimna loreyi]
MIETLQVGVINNTVAVAVLALMSVMCWLVKVLMLLTIFMQRCEAFYLTVQTVRDSCAVILMSNRSDAERKLCKNVLRLNRASFSKIRVCGLVYADAALQLGLVGQLANYSVVLLQFAFL